MERKTRSIASATWPSALGSLMLLPSDWLVVLADRTYLDFQALRTRTANEGFA